MNINASIIDQRVTKIATEPIDGVAAAAGQTGYVPVNQGGVNVGYSITGAGKAANVIITLTSGQ